MIIPTAYCISRTLGACCIADSKTQSRSRDLDCAIAAREQALAVTTAVPSARLQVANSLFSLLIDQDKHRAKSVLQTAVRLLPAISPRSLRRSEQQLNIAGFADMTATAVSLFLDCGES